MACFVLLGERSHVASAGLELFAYHGFAVGSAEFLPLRYSLQGESEERDVLRPEFFIRPLDVVKGLSIKEANGRFRPAWPHL